ncbi:TAXI family TRAP transporter solute-binding subunit [Pseudenhygromyxa sp. WMMC2535]|uniref:TAXI family TRAP transporter solute-binding subunit n=1 Tax=Pseudenhygromyxa sp. WMMC2535 TaxID=2712867 RepID=UPI0020D0B363|nr:TAXI family TRAP transporter solute-binding subunit [Pseudenhygromyxa sp. WMMC2535]
MRGSCWAAALALLVFSLISLAPGLAAAQEPEVQLRPSGAEIRFGTGSAGGGFANTGKAIGAALEGELPLEFQITEGSCDNVRKLARGELDVALVKYDVASEAVFAARAGGAGEEGGGEGEDGEGSGWMCGFEAAELANVELQLVAAIEESAVHVLLRRPVRLDELSGLGQRPIFVGQEGSGSMETSKIVLGAAGLSLEDVNALDIGNRAAMSAMRRGELLMVLRTTKIPTKAVNDILVTGIADINPLPDSVIERLIDGFPYYRACKIPAQSYPGLEREVPTVCVSTVVLTARRAGQDALSNAEVVQMIAGLQDLAAEGEINQLRWRDFAERTPVALHPGAKLHDADDRAREPGEIRFGAGSKSGGFTTLAKALAGALEDIDAEVALSVRTTGGSCDNVRKLARGELDAALVQYAVAAEAQAAGAAAASLSAGEGEGGGEGGGEGEESGESGWMCGLQPGELAGVELELVAAVEDAAAHMLVQRPVRLDDFSSLEQRPIFVGQRGSGSIESSKVILGAAGLTIDDVNALDVSNKASMAAMRRGEILMMLRTTPVGSAQISELVASGTAGLNPLPESIIERLIDGFPYFRVCQIDANSYPGLAFGIPTVCVSTVVLTARREGSEALSEDEVLALIDGLRALERDPGAEVDVEVRWRGFAEREPIPLHEGAAWAERRDFLIYWAKIAAIAALGLGLLLLLRRYLRRRGLLGDPLAGNIEGQLSNPLVPFVGFLLIVGIATLVVWNLEHDSNARVRTLNDSFWEMNMFATGNFDSESLKTSKARVIGVAATVAGLGLLAWFTAALTSILSRDQMRLFRRRRNHIVILNFREEMLQLIRVLRSPGPLRQRSIHVVISEALPARVRAQLTRVRGLTIYEQNPEVPEELLELRLPRAARVIVLQGSYHPLRVARAVHHACVRLDHQARVEGKGERAALGLAPSVQSPALAGDPGGEAASRVPVTLVEADASDMEGLFDPFSRWLIPVPARGLADAWLAKACLEPGFGELFNDIVTFREGNSELYTVELPESLHGKTWRELRRLLFTASGRAGIVPVGIYRGHRGRLAYAEDDVADSSPQAELDRRLQVNPPLDLVIEPGFRLLAFAEDEADLRKVLGR